MKDIFPKLITNSIDDSNVFLLSLPYDKSVTIGSGASKGPSKLKELSTFFPPLSMDGDSLTKIKLFDLGEIEVLEKDDASSYFSKVEQKAKEIFSFNKFLITLGGDHSISIPLQKAFFEYANKIGKIPAIIHLDAHPDICDEYDGNRLSHACPIRRAIDNDYKEENIILIGIRAFEEYEVEYLNSHKELKVYKASSLHQSFDEVINDIKTRFDDRYMVYLSYDIDINDPSFAPGTGTPEPFGLNSIDVLNLIRLIFRFTPIKAMDLVEISPILDDNNDSTSWLGIKTLYEIFFELTKII